MTINHLIFGLFVFTTSSFFVAAKDKGAGGADLSVVLENPMITPAMKSNPCFTSAMEQALKSADAELTKDQEARARATMKKKLKILEAHANDPRKALKEHAKADRDDCAEMAKISSACTFSQCQALSAEMIKVYDNYSDEQIRQTYSLSVAMYSKGSEDDVNDTTLTDKVWLPELERQGQKIKPEEAKMLRELEKNENAVSAGKKTRAQAYLDAIEIMSKTVGKNLSAAEKKALEESRAAAELFRQGKIDEAEFQVRSIEAHSKAAGEPISPQERKELLEQIRSSLVRTTDSSR